MAEEECWFYSSKGARCGPVSDCKLKELADSKQLLPDDLVWMEGMADWQPAKTLDGLFVAKPPPPKTPLPLPPSSGHVPLPPPSEHERSGEREVAAPTAAKFAFSSWAELSGSMATAGVDQSPVRLKPEAVSWIRQRLSSYLSAVGDDIGERIEVLEAGDNYAYRVESQMLSEERSVGTGDRPFRGDSPRPTIARAGIDPWRVLLESPTSYESGETEHPIEESANVTTCPDCRGKKKSTCPKCSGTKHVECPACGGNGTEPCTNCRHGQVEVEAPSTQETMHCTSCTGGQTYRYDGHQKVFETCSWCNGTALRFITKHNSQMISCGRCGGRGWLSCDTCVRKGQVSCPGCSGKGVILCVRCEHTGQVVEYATVVRKLTGNRSDGLAAKSISEHLLKKLDATKDYLPHISVTTAEEPRSLRLTSGSETLGGVIVAGLNECQSGCPATGRLIGTRVQISRAQVLAVKYSFGEKQYSAFLLGVGGQVVAEKSPLTDDVETRVTAAAEEWGEGERLTAVRGLQEARRVAGDDEPANKAFEKAYGKLTGGFRFFDKCYRNRVGIALSSAVAILAVGFVIFAEVSSRRFLANQNRALAEFEKNAKSSEENPPNPPPIARPRSDIILADFEGATYPSSGWKTTGTAFGKGPSKGSLPKQNPVTGFLGKGFVNSFGDGDDTTGRLTSPVFKIERAYLNFQIGGGKYPGKACVNLLVDGKAVCTATGENSDRLDWHSWNTAPFEGRQGVIEVVDEVKSEFGHILVDNFVQSDKSKLTKFAPSLFDADATFHALAADFTQAPEEIKKKHEKKRLTFTITVMEKFADREDAYLKMRFELGKATVYGTFNFPLSERFKSLAPLRLGNELVIEGYCKEMSHGDSYAFLTFDDCVISAHKPKDPEPEPKKEEPKKEEPKKDPPKSDPPVGEFLTVEYLPHKVGKIWTYETTTKAGPDTGAVVQTRITHKDGGLLETTLVKTGKTGADGKVTWGKEQNKKGTPLGIRVFEGYVELGTGAAEAYWEPMLKIGGKPGDTWSWTKLGVGSKSSKVVRLEMLDGHPSAVIEVSGDKGKVNTESTHVYVRGVGEVERTTKVTQNGVVSKFHMRLIEE